MDELNRIVAAADADLDRSVDRLFDLARIPSVSTDPAYWDECRRAAEWLTEDLSRLGFSAALRETSGRPMVVAYYEHPSHGSRTRCSTTSARPSG